jgi:hypothetical protein
MNWRVSQPSAAEKSNTIEAKWMFADQWTQQRLSTSSSTHSIFLSVHHHHHNRIIRDNRKHTWYGDQKKKTFYDINFHRSSRFKRSKKVTFDPHLLNLVTLKPPLSSAPFQAIYYDNRLTNNPFFSSTQLKHFHFDVTMCNNVVVVVCLFSYEYE